MVTADLEGLVEGSISRLGVHLIDLVVKTEGQTKAVELFIDSEEGVTTELCSAVSREIDSMIESADRWFRARGWEQVVASECVSLATMAPAVI